MANDGAKVKEYRALKLSWSVTAKLLYVTPTALIRRSRERGIYE